MAAGSIKITCRIIAEDRTPFDSFVRLVQMKQPFRPSELAFKCFRIEVDHVCSTATTCDFVVRFYPSDAFLRHVATLFTSDRDDKLVDS